MSKAKFTLADFDFSNQQAIVDALNLIDADTDELVKKSAFCREHCFLREADYLDTRIRSRTGVLVDVCNSLGKYF
jgi:hypothetical protein